MFDNLANIHDIPLLIEKIRQGRFTNILSRIVSRRGDWTFKTWDHLEYAPKNWWDIPDVMRRWNRMISGDPDVDYFSYFMNRFYAGKSSLRALSLGCGTGHRELDLAALDQFSRIDAIDRSEKRIAHARAKARERGYDQLIRYQAGDVFSMELCDSCYDLVIVEQSLHHFSPLETILRMIGHCLSQDGFLLFNEFTGPSRFQWTDKQIEAVNGLLSLLPERYRIRWKSRTLKRRVHRPGRLGMILYDSTEAVESSRILPHIHKLFDVVELAGYGGTVLQLLFNDIAHNFLSNDNETKRLLALCFDAEDELLESGQLESDFIVGICRKRTPADSPDITG
ncbi:MAG TPA: class I SAM-dependent methyltransferase [Patescibacteria group bacterium]|nr:class I SAM-dependent methyltransferase [Patescibacteria group bacterium]